MPATKKKQEYDREWRKKKQQDALYMQRRREVQRRAIDKARDAALFEFDRRGGACAECGYKGPYCHFEWAHIPGHSKVNCISTLMCQGSLRKLKEEFPKVLLKCRFCHAEETAYDNKSRLSLSFHVALTW